MKKLIFIMLMGVCSVTLFAQTYEWMWAKRAGGTNADNGEFISTYSTTYNYYPNSRISFEEFRSAVDIYPNMSLGSGGTSGAFNLAFGLSLASKLKHRNILLSFGLSSIFNGDDVPSNVHEYPCPHSSYTVLGKKQKGNEIGFLLRYGTCIKENRNRVFVYGVGEFSVSEDILLSKSNVTGWYYEESSKSMGYGSLGLGVGYNPGSGKSNLFMEYNYRRGIGFGIGFKI
ncbi:MAG TPA: hypothetical protein PK802_06710 [Candidatus Cloacimonadota bacterium]|nr:hypothetical protein [Candidatus Cloacimonadota bacterium]HOR59136.1 hypothetical protein [Candidatus Cloacimonadota bacterium]HPB09362.1 hypothetical protein [Candidatus Cloacimonadota bacterium]HQP18357.1 hypothetical protein [Candidatus Cloacimonadota bacterium]